MEKTHNFAYRPDIDGLRALAVVAVIIFHFAPSLLHGGFLGVDVFFVISGYLITGILLKEHSAGGIRLGNFWVRRIRRLLPAFAVMAFAVCLLSWAFMPASMAYGAASQTIATTVASSNWYLWKISSNYWGQAAESAPLLHTWSLSVEEQFYLIFPFIAWFGLRSLGVKSTGYMLWIITLICVLYSYNLGLAEPSKAFFLTPSRAWELLAGVMLAFAGSSVPEFLRSIWARSIGLILIILSFVFVSGKGFTPFPSALGAVLGAAIICLPPINDKGSSRLLNSPLALYIGKASYSLYLWHWPPLVMSSAFILAWPDSYYREFAMGVGIILGLISYHFIEPFGRTERFPRLWAPAGAVLLLVVAFAIRFDSRSSAPEVPNIQTSIENANVADVFLIGDSHAAALYFSLKDKIVSNRGKLIASAVSATAIVPGFNKNNTSSFNSWTTIDGKRKALLEKGIRNIVIQCRWESYASDSDLLDVKNL